MGQRGLEYRCLSAPGPNRGIFPHHGCEFPWDTVSSAVSGSSEAVEGVFHEACYRDSLVGRGGEDECPESPAGFESVRPSFCTGCALCLPAVQRCLKRDRRDSCGAVSMGDFDSRLRRYRRADCITRLRDLRTNRSGPCGRGFGNSGHGTGAASDAVALWECARIDSLVPILESHTAREHRRLECRN